MKRASNSEATNGLSRFLSDVRSGETVQVTHHGKPVAQIKPYDTAELTADAAAMELARQEVIDPPQALLDVEHFLSLPVPRLPEGCSVSHFIVSEQDEGS